MKKDWKQLTHNEVLQKDGYYISYNGNTDLNLEGRGETALVLEKEEGKRFWILNGDYRKEYEECESVKEAVKVFLKHKEDDHAFWSDYGREGDEDLVNSLVN